MAKTEEGSNSGVKSVCVHPQARAHRVEPRGWCGLSSPITLSLTLNLKPVIQLDWPVSKIYGYPCLRSPKHRNRYMGPYLFFIWVLEMKLKYSSLYDKHFSK